MSNLNKSVFLGTDNSTRTVPSDSVGYKVVKNGKDTAIVELNDPRPSLSYKQMKKIVERNR